MLGRALLVDIAEHPRLHGPFQQAGAVRAGEDEEAGRGRPRRPGTEVAERREPVAVRALQVGRADVRQQGSQTARRAAPRGVVDRQVRFPAQPLRQDRSDQTLVVHQKNPDHCPSPRVAVRRFHG
ncbi:hypothetical protein AQJ23_23540 [Streptomyces antibioticus]|nr:hypothetical protein AQJ23_23540 [Streptomyces antibioticus]